MMYVSYEDRIWPSIFYSSSESIKQQILIRSIVQEPLDIFIRDDDNTAILTVDDTITVVTFKSKTVQSALTEIAGLLVLTSILRFFLINFHEWRFNQKMKKETNEEFR